MIALLPVLILMLVSVPLSEKMKKSMAVSYFIVLMASLNILYLASLVDLLRPAAILLYAAFFGIIVLYLFKRGWTNACAACKQHFDWYAKLNAVSSVLFAVIFTMQKPGLYYWDELNIWGPSAKSVKLFHQLYSIGLNPCTNDRNYPAGNALLNYFYSFFSQEFAEHLLLLSYALLYVAAFSMIAWVIYDKTKNHIVGVSSYFVLFLSPFMACYHMPQADYQGLSYAYGTSMVDFNLAVVFAAAIALYFANRNALWHVLPLVYLVTIKKNGIFFLLLAVCVIACFEIFSRQKARHSFKKICIILLASLLLPLLAYQAWFWHLDYYEMPLQEPEFSFEDTEKPVETEQGALAEEQEQTEVTVQAKNENPTIWSLLIPQLRTERYNEILDEMEWYFKNNHETIFGADKYLIVILLGFGLAAAYFAKKEYRFSVLFTGLGLTAGCFVYNLVIAYQMQFYNDGMVEYPRYMVSYYFGWMFMVLLLFVTSDKICLTAKQILLSVVMLSTVVSIGKMGLDYTVIAGPKNVRISLEYAEQQAAAIKDIVDEDDRIYLVYKDQDGETYIKYRYLLLPNLAGMDTKGTGIDFSINFREGIDYTSDRQYYLVASPEKFTEAMQSYFDYIYVIDADKEFKNSYGQLFSGGIEKGGLYKITDESIPMQAVALCEEK